MKNKYLSLLLALGALTSASGQVVVFEDDFSTDTLEANYKTEGVNYNAAAETVTLQRGYNSPTNHLEISDTFDLDSANTTELTIAFDYAFSSAMYGSEFVVEYNDNSGTGWQTVATISYTGTNSNDDGQAANPFSVTIIEGSSYSFTNSASIRIRSNDTGSKGYHIDNFTVSVDVATLPSKGTVIMISSVSCWLILIPGFLVSNETRRNRRSK